jgi:pyridoxamine 5'-phosphate oxidase family protein
MFDDVELAYLRSQRLARLATVSPEGQPDNSPVAFDFDGEFFWVGGFNILATRKYHNVEAGEHKVALVIDDLESIEPWRPRGIRVYGTAAAVAHHGQIGHGDYLRITPVISWSWALEIPFSADVDAARPSRKRTTWGGTHRSVGT